MCLPLLVLGQNFNKNDFMKADFELLSGNYDAAQRIYERLLHSDPENANLNFLNGLCLINLPGRKQEALPFLAKAAPKASEKYKYGSPREENAPLESLKHYGIALQVTGDLPEAIEMLTRYKKALPKKERSEIELADKLLASCYASQKLQSKPVFFTGTDQGGALKSDAPMLHLVVSRDETLLFYSQSGKYGKDEIFVSQKENGSWSSPQKITSNLGVRGECFPTSVSADKSRLYLTQKVGVTVEVMVSEFRKGKWQRMEEPGKPINGKDLNASAVESADGEYLYFSSDRKGGHGKLDIYRAQKIGDGSWDEPENLGSVINTGDEERPLVVTGNVLYFLSQGHENMGGYDVFETELTPSGVWSTPRNVGYPLNTADDDLSLAPLGDQIYAYKAVKGYSEDSPYSIQKLEIFSDNHPREFNIYGTLSLEGGEIPSNAKIEVYNSSDYSLVADARPESGGWYSLMVPAGSYRVNYSSPQYKTSMQLLDLKQDNPQGSLSYNVTLNKEAPVVEDIVWVQPEEEAAYAYAETVVDESEYAFQAPVERSTSTEPETAYSLPATTDTSPVRDTYTSYDAGGATGNYTVQFMATLKPVSMDYVLDKYRVEIQQGDDGYYRYVTGSFDSFEDGRKLQQELISADYTSAYIRPHSLTNYLENAVKEKGNFTVQFFASRKKLTESQLRGVTNLIESPGSDGWYRYSSGEYQSVEEASTERQRLVGLGYQNAYIRRVSSISNYSSEHAK